MIVNQLSTFPFGGAGTAALRCHSEMRLQGVDSRFFYRQGLEWRSADRSVNPVPLSLTPKPKGFFARRRERLRRRRVIRQYERHLAGRPTNMELFSQPQLLDAVHFPADWDWGQIVHLHWIPFLLDLPSFFAAMPEHIPLVWTLHDMNPFTGGCHFSGGCSRFKTGCGNCPAIDQPGPRDISYEANRIKQRALNRTQVQVVTPSRWLGNLARQSPVWPMHTDFQVIPYGLNLQQFRPIEKSAARHKLGLPQNVPLIAFGAEDVENQRKGFHLLIHSLRTIFPKSSLECLVFGRGDVPAKREGLPIFHEFGFVDQIERQVLIYSAADVLVMPSLEDNSPQTGLEAMACGTPVVAFDAGGISEFVIPGQTGLLAAVGNVADLAKQINDLAEHTRLRQRLAAGSRKLIEAEYDVRTQVRKYIDLYSTLLGRSRLSTHRRAA